ncbi:hypothetical protein [Bradyrhizobium sp. SZCCHNS2005]|nr:hypothetical protein [Bradyrhizobium sp. SZCCHNS2005]
MSQIKPRAFKSLLSGLHLEEAQGFKQRVERISEARSILHESQKTS